jgi:signal transduction histidine kinase
MDTPAHNESRETQDGHVAGIHRWYRRWIEPRSVDEDLRRRELIFNILIIGTLFLLILLYIVLVVDYFHDIHDPKGYVGISPLIFPFIIAAFASLYVLSRRGRVNLAAYSFVIIYAVFTTYTAATWGIDIPIALISFAFVVILASILVNSRFAIILTGVVSMLLAVLGYYQSTYHPEMSLAWRSISLGSADGLDFGLIILGIGFVSWLSNREIARSLRRARKSEAELVEEKSLLEVRVEERTCELQQAQMEKAAELYRFAEFGKLATGLFHDFINAFNGVLLDVGQFERLRQGLQSGDDVSGIMHEYLADALEGSKRMDRFVGVLRKQIAGGESMGMFSLNDTLRDAAYLMSYKANVARVTFRFAIPEEQIVCYGNELALSHVISNLIVNAIDAYDGVVSRIVPVAAKIVTLSLSEQDGRAIITIADHGMGIPAHIIGRIFEPFFTTKRNGKGMGIGLALAKKYVEDDFGGTIECTTDPGSGSRFCISIPIFHHAHHATSDQVAGPVTTS